MTVKILTPCNFTQNDQKAVQYVGKRYGGEEDVEVTLFHVYTPPPEIDVTNNPIMEKMQANVSYLRMQTEEQKRALEKIKKDLVDYGFKATQVEIVFQPVKVDAATDIINQWKQGKFNIVVLTRNPGSIVNYFSRSITKRVIRWDNGKINVEIVN